MPNTSTKTKSKNGKKLNETTRLFIKTQILMALSDLVLLLIGSFIVYSFEPSKKAYFYISIFLFCISAFISGYYCGFKLHKKGLVTGLIFCLPLNLLIVLISLIINKFSFDLTFVITLLLLLISSMLGGILSVNTRMKAKNHRKG